MDLQVLKFKFHSYNNFKQASYPLHLLLYRVTLTTQKYFYESFPLVSGCQTNEQ